MGLRLSWVKFRGSGISGFRGQGFVFRSFGVCGLECRVLGFAQVGLVWGIDIRFRAPACLGNSVAEAVLYCLWAPSGNFHKTLSPKA